MGHDKTKALNVRSTMEFLDQDFLSLLILARLTFFKLLETETKRVCECVCVCFMHY